ncbi:MAG: Conserved putative secreted protein [Acidimicrobiales bacterium]|jgi:hypothetical protein|nr:Conserved putative secreted protein [Acidimicrobiales bacterium]
MGQNGRSGRRRAISVAAGAATTLLLLLSVPAPAFADPGTGQGATHQSAQATDNAAGAPGNSQSDAHATEGTAGTSGVVTSPQPPSNADENGTGANVPGPYDSTRSGLPSGNGNGNGQATGKPCAGCVGKADNKNPPGQLPGPSDKNAGYECDTNHGIARTNPAHTGCVPPAACTANCTPTTCTADCSPSTSCTADCTPSSVLGEELVRTPAVPAAVAALAISAPRAAPSGVLAFTGVNIVLLVGLAAMALISGLLLQAPAYRRRLLASKS